MNVLDLMNFRRESKSKPLCRKDSFKLGLAIEGGGMRGVVSAGMLTALEHLGYTDTFDEVYGASAGAINSAYFFARQSAYGTSIYYNEANCSDFISWPRVFLNKPPMQLDYLIYKIFGSVKFLDWESMLASGVKINILASSLDRGKTVLLNNFSSQEDVFISLKASACIPWFAGPPVTINGERFVDASFFQSIPYESAVTCGCTHVLVLRTRPFGIRRDAVSLLERVVLKRYFKGKDKQFYDYYVNQRSQKYNHSVEFLESDCSKKGPDGVQFLSCALESSYKQVGQLEKKKATLLNGAIAGYNSLLRLFGVKEVTPIDVISPFNQHGACCSFQQNGQ